MNEVIKQHFVLQELADGSWAIRQYKDGNIWPATYKPNARAMMSRLSQLLDVGPVAPQMEPEQICISDDGSGESDKPAFTLSDGMSTADY